MYIKGRYVSANAFGLFFLIFSARKRMNSVDYICILSRVHKQCTQHTAQRVARNI